MKQLSSVVLVLVCLAILVLAVGVAYADKPTVRGDSVKGPRGIASMCIEGHVFVVATGRGTGPATSVTQVYQEKNGKIVPMKCESR
jgi:hypothetical protein